MASMKILVVKRDKIGDLLLTTPMLRHLKASLPQAEIHLLATDYNAWVVEGNRDIDRCWIYRRVRRFDLGAFLQGLALRSRLRRERFDWVLVGNGDESPRAIRWGAGVRGKRTVAYCSSAFAGITDPLPVKKGVHEMDRLLALLGPMGIPMPARPPWPRYLLPSASAAFAREWLGGKGLAADRYVVIGLGARRAKKQPAAEQVLRWSAHLKEQWGLDTVFMWTPGRSDDPLYPGDDAIAQPVLDAGKPFIQPFRGPIPQALGLIWSARTSVFPDSGLMHFAAASPGGVLGLFAETDVSPAPAQWAPRGPKVEWLDAPKAVADLPDSAIHERLGRLIAS
jgi:ADP-heptose:LPS heptosyltransferase